MSKEYKIFLSQEEPKPEGQYQDNLFPPNESSLLGTIESNSKKINASEIEWKRASEIFPQPYLFENLISIDDVKQGKMDICYFLSSIAALCEFPGLITKIFITQEYNPNGFYKLVLFIEGEYQIVYLDDYFPCIKGTDIPYFSKPNSYELWVLLLEKAWAKINGGYANIINGWPSEVFKAFTGFGCESLIFKEENEERIWRLLKTINENSGVICCSSKDSGDVEKAGLLSNYTYTLIDTLEFEDEKKNPVYLCKLFDPWRQSQWNGDWGEQSDKWTENIKKELEKEALPNGVFFISIKDLIKYFCRSDFCQIIYDGYAKTFDFSQDALSEPQIFNFFLHKQGNVSITVAEKKWRQHKELIGVNHPTSLVLGEYDPSLKIIKHICCDYKSYDDVEKTRRLNPGFYVLWVYKGLAESEKPAPESMKVRFVSEGKISIKLVGPDKNCEAIKQIICQGAKLQKRGEIKNREIYYDICNNFKRSGLAYRLIINPLATAYQKWDLNASEIKGYSLLPPFAKQEKFSIQVGPNNFGIILAIKNQSFGSFFFNLKAEVEQYECREGEDPTESKRMEFNSFCLGDINLEDPIPEKETISLKDAMEKVRYPKVDHALVFAEKYKDQTPLIQDELIKMDPQEGNKRLGWVKLNKNNGVYYGEADYMTPQGRGLFIFNKEDLIWIGYFDKGKKGNYGKLYTKNGTLLYEGEYKGGKRNGNGVYYYPGGCKYEGEFVNGLREGKGSFQWEDGTKWEGTFKDNEMNGDGVFFDGEESFPARYENGDLVE